jgi:hypothetical protein
MLRLLFLLNVVLLTGLGSASAQDGVKNVTIGNPNSPDFGAEIPIKGKVVSLVDKEPVIGAVIEVPFLKTGTITDVNGRYTLRLPQGDHRLVFRYLGLEDVYVDLQLYSPGFLHMGMTESSINLEEIVIEAGSEDNFKEVVSGVERLTLKDIKELPAFLGEVDVVKSLLMLPGVSTVGEGASGFNVRGGRVDQNLVLLNGGQLFNSSHVLGFFSVFNPDVTDDFTLYKGNVPSKFGGRLSSVLDVNTRTGDMDDVKIQGGLGIASSRLAIEGPINKGKTSFLVGGRMAYSDWFLNFIKNTDVRNSEANFYDANVVISHKFKDANTLTASYYRSYDKLNFADDFGFDWSTDLASLEWANVVNQQFSYTTSAHYGGYRSTLFDPEGFDAAEVSNGIDYWQVDQNFDYILNDRHTFSAGFDIVDYQGIPEVRAPIGGESNVLPKEVAKDRGREYGVYIGDEVTLNRNLSINLGLRYSYFQHYGPKELFEYEEGTPRNISTIIDTSYFDTGEAIKSFSGLEPRLALRYQLSEMSSIKMSYNRMRQYIHLISNSAAASPIDVWQVSNFYLDPQVADSYSIGYFRNFQNNTVESSLEFYYKDIKSLVEYKDFAELLLNQHIETELLTGIGRAYGAEVYLKKTSGFWTGWLSYEYSRSFIQVAGDTPEETINDGEWFPANYDKPHTINFVAKRKLWNGGSFGTNFTYNTGRPFTALESNYESDGTTVPQFSDRNAYRIPDYWRLDISFTIGNVINKLDDNLNFSIYNVFGRRNAYSVFYRRESPSLIPKPFKLSVLGSAFPSITYNFKI